MIHMMKGNNPERDTKTACGVKLEELKRADCSVPYASRGRVECEACRKAAEKIARMRGEKV
jgi:hypothetical protein